MVGSKMPYLDELHYCQICGVCLGYDDSDGICSTCDLEEDDLDKDDEEDEESEY
jgi:hypothetical protein